MSIPEDPPEGIDVSRSAWHTARAIYARLEKIEGEAMSQAQIEQDTEAYEWECVLSLARLVDEYRKPFAPRCRVHRGKGGPA